MLKTVTNKKAAFNFWQTIAIGSVFAWLLVSFDGPLNRLVTGKDKTNHLVVRSVAFENGYFSQQIDTEAGTLLKADWSASIFQDFFHICSGSGSATYGGRNMPVLLEPNDWTGDECNLVAGEEYEARAAWSYFDADGDFHQATRVFFFTYSEPAE